MMSIKKFQVTFDCAELSARSFLVARCWGTCTAAAEGFATWDDFHEFAAT